MKDKRLLITFSVACFPLIVAANNAGKVCSDTDESFISHKLVNGQLNPELVVIVMREEKLKLWCHEENMLIVDGLASSFGGKRPSFQR